jgi:hypothetical protein
VLICINNTSNNTNNTIAHQFWHSQPTQHLHDGHCSYVWTFGAPGHGKGVYDGLGGIIKNKSNSLIKETKSSCNPIPGTESGYINSPKDVYDALAAAFGHELYQQRRKKGKNSISLFSFSYFGTNNNPIRRAEGEEFKSLDKISSNYQFTVSDVGVVYSRMRSCWCLKCYAALTDGSKHWLDTHSVRGCTSSFDTATNVYKFEKKECWKIRGVNANLELQQRKRSRNEMSSTLTTGAWVIFKSDGDEDQLFWLGKTVGKSDWDESCTWFNDTGSQKSIDGALIPANTYAINVQWYTQKTIGILEYEIEGGENAKPLVNSNSSLICVVPNEQVVRVVGMNVRVPRRRRVQSNQMDDFEYSTRQSLQTTEGEWYRREFGNLYRLHDSIRDIAMEAVHQWREGN